MSNNDKSLTETLTHPNTVLIRLIDMDTKDGHKAFRASGPDYLRRQDDTKNEFVRDPTAPKRKNLHPIDNGVSVSLYRLLDDFRALGWQMTSVVGDATDGYGTSSGVKYRTTLAFNPPGHTEPPLKDDPKRDAAIEAAFWPRQYADEVAAHRAANEFLRLHPGDIVCARTFAIDAAAKAVTQGDAVKIANATVAAINWDEKSRAVAAGDHNHGVQGLVVSTRFDVWVNFRTTSVDFNRCGTSPVEGAPKSYVRFNDKAPTLEQCWWLEDEAGNHVTAEETRRRVAAYRADKDAEREAFAAWHDVIKPVVNRGDSPFARWGEAMGRADAVAYSVYVKVFSPEEAAKKTKAFIAGINWRAKAEKLVAKRAARRS